MSKQRVQAKRASDKHMRLVSCAQSRAKTKHSSLNKQRISKTTQKKFIYANTLDVSKTCTSKTLIPGGHATLLLQDWKKTIENQRWLDQKRKKTCRERLKGNVGLHTSTLQSHRQSDTNRNHKNTHTTHTEIISCDNKILCKEEEHKYTNLVLKRGACVWERCFVPKEKCGSGSARGCALRTNLQNKTQWGRSGSARGCALRTNLQNKTQWGIRKRKEWRKRERIRARRGRKGHFLKFSFRREVLFIFYFG